MFAFTLESCILFRRDMMSGDNPKHWQAYRSLGGSWGGAGLKPVNFRRLPVASAMNQRRRRAAAAPAAAR